MRTLIVRRSSLGDVVCTLPCATAIKQANPESTVTWVVDVRFASIVKHCPDVDEVVEVGKDAREALRTVRNLGGFDYAFDLQGLLKSAMLVGAARAKEKFGFHWQREGARLFSSPVLPEPSSLHVTDQYVDVVRAAGFPADQAPFCIEPRAEALFTAQALLEGAGPGPRVAINAGGAWASKRWPAEKVAALCQRLAERGVLPVLIGGPGEEDLAQSIADAADVPMVNAVARTGLPELIALLSLMDAHVGGDTGSTHLMAALGRPAIGLYATTRPERTCPYGQFDRCLYRPGDLPGIPVEEVLDQVMQAITVA